MFALLSSPRVTLSAQTNQTFAAQDAVLFSGTVRENTGPFDEYSDESVTAAAGDEKIVMNLDTKVSTGGSNFSQGQRQLLTMVRALLRQSSIIILDEATSSIDFDTDAKIQKTISREFPIVTVVHRLRTIIDYDWWLVLDNGRIAEFNTLYNLIQKENVVFRGMCMHSASFKELDDAATAAEAK